MSKCHPSGTCRLRVFEDGPEDSRRIRTEGSADIREFKDLMGSFAPFDAGDERWSLSKPHG